MCYGMGCPFENDLGECNCTVEQECYMEKIKKEKEEERVYQEFVEIILGQKNTFYCPYWNSSYLEFNKEDNLFTCEHCGQIYDLEDLTKAYYEEMSKLSENHYGRCRQGPFYMATERGIYSTIPLKNSMF